MTAKLPRVLCLDLGGVVVRICRSWEEACERAGVAHDPGIGVRALERAKAQEALGDQLHRGVMGFDEYATRMATLLGGPTVEEITRVHDVIILGDYPGVRELLERLASRGVAIACLSNTNDRHWEQMRTTSNAFAAIRHRHASHLLHLAKPDPQIYEAFERAMACTPRDILFVDDLHENVAAARARGWRALRIDHSVDPVAQIERALASFSQRDPRTLPSPLATRTLTGTDGPGGLVKARPGDFLVDELSDLTPSGEGEHLLLGIHKSGVAHDEMLRVVATHCGVRLDAIGFAGIKDRRAETRQTISVNLPHGTIPGALVHPGIAVLWTRWHSNKLRRGQLSGNRFAIRVREVDPMIAPTILRRLRALESSGIPNAFGPQRFGSRLNNHRLGLLALQERWDELVGELTGLSNLPFPPHQREAREACEQGRWSASVPLWGANDTAERLVALGLSRGWKPARAVKSLGGERLRFWISALQSAIFNRVLDQRIDDGALATVNEGDVVIDGTTNRCTRVDATGLAMARDAAATRELSATALLPGAKMLEASNAAHDAEQAAMDAFGTTLETFTQAPFPPSGARRPVRVFLTNPALEAGADEYGPFVKVSFDLPPGAFATTVLAELFGPLRSGEAPDEDDQSSSSTSSSSSSDGSMTGGGAP